MIKVKVQDISGSALDWAVGTSEGYRMDVGQRRGQWYAVIFIDAYKEKSIPRIYQPTKDWLEVGPMIVKCNITLNAPDDESDGMSKEWEAWCGSLWATDPRDPLVAICRAVVTATSGTFIEIPDELWSGENKF